MKQARFVFAATLMVIDIAMSILAFYLAYKLRLLSEFQNLPPRFLSYLPVVTVQIASTVTVFSAYRLYYRKRAMSALDELYALFGALSVSTLIGFALITIIFKNDVEYPRLMVIYAWGLSLVLLTAGRLIHNRIQRMLQARHFGEENVLIVGTGEVGRLVLQKIRSSPSLGYKVVGFVDVNGGPRQVLGTSVLGKAIDIPRLIEEYQVDEVIIGLPEASHQDIVGIISLCERERVSIKVFPDVFQIMASEVSIGDLGGLPLLTIRDVALRGWRLTLKRAMDIFLSVVALVFCSPFMLLMGLLIKLESPGPVFFTQERMGLDAQPFLILKFRSMRPDAERLSTWTRHGDPRVTRLGRWLRRLSVDELPQLINVLLGDMSLVGPRPEQPVYVEQFRKSIPRYMDRHREKAGLTGWAQVNGLRGDTSIAERTKYDLWYIENWSLWLDIKILLRTVFTFLFDRSAY